MAALLGDALRDGFGPGFAVEDCRVELGDYGRQLSDHLGRGSAAAAGVHADMIEEWSGRSTTSTFSRAIWNAVRGVWGRFAHMH